MADANPATQGAQPVFPITDVCLDFARKEIAGARALFFFGHNDAVGNAFEDITPEGGDYPWQTSALTLEVLSMDVNDTSDGVGVRQVEIHGLGPAGADQEEVLTTNGTTVVDTALTYCRINKTHNENVGTYGGSHEGAVTIQVKGGGAIQGRMTGHEGTKDASVQYGIGEISAGRYTVPLGKVLYITDLSVTITGSGSATADVILYEREGILNVAAPFDPRRVVWNTTKQQGLIQKSFKSHIKIKQLTDLWFRAKSSTGTVTVDVYLDFYLLDRNSAGA
jgi:hypothetical protein